MKFVKKILPVVSALLVLAGLYSMSDLPSLHEFCNEATPGYIDQDGRSVLSQIPDNYCYDFSEAYGPPLFLNGLSLLVVSLILLFVRESVYKSWLRFAYWAVPISIIILWLAPTSTPGGIGISFLDFTKQSASWLVSSAFLLISLWIIVSRSLRATSK